MYLFAEHRLLFAEACIGWARSRAKHHAEIEPLGFDDSKSFTVEFDSCGWLFVLHKISITTEVIIV